MVKRQRPFVIEPLNLSSQLQERLNKILTSNINSIRKGYALQKYGKCLKCGVIPTTLVKYKIQGITLVEKYCDKCLKSVLPISKRK
jgi:hypothetical protein